MSRYQFKMTSVCLLLTRNIFLKTTENSQ